MPQEIVNSVSEAEKKRQEAINEVIYTERDFVRDMEYLRDVRYDSPLSICFLFVVLTKTLIYLAVLDQPSQRIRHHTTIPTDRFPRASILEYPRHHRCQHTTPRRAQQATKVLCGRGTHWGYSVGSCSPFWTICLIWCSSAVWKVRV